MTKEHTYEEMMDIVKLEKGQPVKTKWFKHKTKPIYKFQLDIFGEMLDYEEVKDD